MAVAVLGTQLMTTQSAQACSTVSGSVNGTNTVDDWSFTENFGAGNYVLGVRARGDGDNSLTIRVQTRGSGGGWNTIASGEIDLGNTNGCGYREVQFSLSSSSEVRYRLSRKILTKQVDYAWDHDFIVFWGGQQFRCLSC